MTHLANFKGVLHVDGYAGFERLTGNGDIILAACWAHTRRKFYGVAEATGSPVAAEALRQIAELHAVEVRVRSQSSAHRLAERRSFSRPIVQALHTWLEAQLLRVAGRSTLAEAIRYALSRWEGLTRFLHDGRIELDTNPVERAIRPVALGRKNHLFAGSDGGGSRWAIVCSLIETCLCRARHRQVYAARRTMPNGSGMARRCHAGVVDRVHGSPIPFGIVWSFRAPRGRRAGGRSAGSGFACRARTA